MSGGAVSYNLRPNKYVERHLFIELLAILIAGKNYNNVVYVSLGGPQMEDHRVIHQQFGLQKMVSLELDPAIHGRQLFNRRPSFIKCLNCPTGEFITDFSRFVNDYADSEFIIWLDYTNPRSRLEQLLEYQSLLRQLQPGDVLKITLNANPGSLAEKMSREPEGELRERRLAEFTAQFGEHFPAELIRADDMTGHRLPVVLCQLTQKFTLDIAPENPRVRAVPLAVFCYQDGGHQMLTITVQLMRTMEVDENLQKIRKAGWTEYLPDHWTSISYIRVPNLTVKERLLVEERLFTADNETVHAGLPFRFDSDERVSLNTFEEYARHYRRYPSYFQVVL